MANEEQATRRRLRQLTETLAVNRETIVLKREENAKLKIERDALKTSISIVSPVGKK